MLYLGSIEDANRYEPSLNVHCEDMLSWVGRVTELERLSEGVGGAA